MARVVMYTTAWCGFCYRAKALLEGHGIPYDEVSLDHEPRFRERLLEATGGWTVPQIVIDDRPIGGYRELRQLDRAGVLSRLAA